MLDSLIPAFSKNISLWCTRSSYRGISPTNNTDTRVHRFFFLPPCFSLPLLFAFSIFCNTPSLRNVLAFSTYKKICTFVPQSTKYVSVRIYIRSISFFEHEFHDSNFDTMPRFYDNTTSAGCTRFAFQTAVSCFGIRVTLLRESVQAFFRVFSYPIIRMISRIRSKSDTSCIVSQAISSASRSIVASPFLRACSTFALNFPTWNTTFYQLREPLSSRVSQAFWSTFPNRRWWKG